MAQEIVQNNKLWDEWNLTTKKAGEVPHSTHFIWLLQSKFHSEIILARRVKVIIIRPLKNPLIWQPWFNSYVTRSKQNIREFPLSVPFCVSPTNVFYSISVLFVSSCERECISRRLSSAVCIFSSPFLADQNSSPSSYKNTRVPVNCENSSRSFTPIGLV